MVRSVDLNRPAASRRAALIGAAQAFQPEFTDGISNYDDDRKHIQQWGQQQDGVTQRSCRVGCTCRSCSFGQGLY